MIIEILEPPSGEEPDRYLLRACLIRCVQYTKARKITISCTDRVPDDAPAYQHPQWLEFIMRIDYEGEGGLTIGAIQRDKEAEIEFHL